MFAALLSVAPPNTMYPPLLAESLDNIDIPALWLFLITNSFASDSGVATTVPLGPITSNLPAGAVVPMPTLILNISNTWISV